MTATTITTDRTPLTIIGEPPFATDESGKLVSRIATVFPQHRVLVTVPGTHAWQRVIFGEHLNAQFIRDEGRSLSAEEEASEYLNSVDLIIEPGLILIRPDPMCMALAFEADELLQDYISKHQIRFLQVTNQSVRQAIKERGECWRISPLPRTAAEMQSMIEASRLGIRGRPIYYFNKMTGTRYLTLQQLASLENLDADELAGHLHEVQEFAFKSNRLHHPEVDFFLAGAGFGKKDFAQGDFLELEPAVLRGRYRELLQKFRSAVPSELHLDDLENPHWRNQMFTCLVGQKDEILSEEILQGLSPEFFLQIEWLPGCRFEEGELIFDSIFDEPERASGGEYPCPVDPKVKNFIFNFIREFGDLQYINLGRVVSTLSLRPKESGRREVYIAEVKPRAAQLPAVRILRMQKWGIREHLMENKDMLTAIMESEEYTEYTLDRRLGCRQLCMNLPSRFDLGRISERYSGARPEYARCLVWATYFERDYVYGVATDKVVRSKFNDSAFALQFAHLLGRAAAANIIVGRCAAEARVLFDDGDEVLMEDEHSQPKDIVVADFTGAFREYKNPLAFFAPAYAQPIIRRALWVPQPTVFARVYIDAFISRFLHIQGEYRKRRRAFDTLFQHRRRDEQGSFAFRWERILWRLDHTDATELGKALERETAIVSRP
jgi:hypothetical protein